MQLTYQEIKFPITFDNNKTKYLIINYWNQHVANILYKTYVNNLASSFQFFLWKVLDFHVSWLILEQAIVFWEFM